MSNGQELTERVKKTFEILNRKLENEDLTVAERKQLIYDLDHLIDYLPELEVIQKKEIEDSNQSSNKDN